ncbi:hypothetical protein NBRC3222_2609 [Acetobacter pasteurianus NBRC 3222]|nr:hypothetical protein NBRC106471_2658 [Acetobacter pasteurianus subsp. pasteurianus LMG 1262 = NBRC 106471]GCD57272.1 hypothetical protein NBRC3222_2609 [Acetobacter pasteurianus NBRC 3222]
MDSNSVSLNAVLILLLYSVVVFIVTRLWFSERRQCILAFCLLTVPAFLAALCGGSDTFFSNGP